MIIDCISDLHGFKPKLEGGDLLLIAGDSTARDTYEEWDDFCDWLDVQPYKYKVVIAGNHDGNLHATLIDNMRHCFYLQDSGIELEGKKIYGSPWTPTFLRWYFMKDRGFEIRRMWDLIPHDTDILLTHGPMYGVLDKSSFSWTKKDEKNVGCEELRMKFDDGTLRPKLHVFGHIHECYGYAKNNKTLHVNAAIMDEKYDPCRSPIRVMEMESGEFQVVEN